MTPTTRKSASPVGYAATDDRDVLALISTVQEGIPYSDFRHLADASPFTLAEWSGLLHVSERTLQRYKKESRSFDAAQSDRILQIALVNRYGAEVFGSEARYLQWLETPNLTMGGATPKSLLDNSFGVGLVRDELTRIEHGVGA